MTRLPGVAAALAVVALTVGCADVPAGGPVRLAGPAPVAGSLDESSVRVQPAGPAPGASPTAVVQGFLQASDGWQDTDIARQFLTDAAGSTWSPVQVLIYGQADLTPLAAHGTRRAQVRLALSEVGALGPTGLFDPLEGTRVVSLQLVRTAGGWRVTNPPAAMLVSQVNFLRFFQPANVYFVSPVTRTLVPVQVYVDVSRSGLATELVRDLVTGPGSWLRGAITSGVPAGAALPGNVPYPDGIALVDFASGHSDQSRPVQVTALGAQLVYTLRQLPDVTAVHIGFDGAPLASFPTFGPDARLAVFQPVTIVGSQDYVYVDAGTVRSAAGSTAVQWPRLDGLSDPAFSAGAPSAAVLRTTDSGTQLWVTSAGRHWAVAAQAAGFTRPSVDLAGNVWTVATSTDGTQHVLRCPAGGRCAAVPAAPLLRLGPVRSLRVASDGTRVAAVVDRGGAGQVVVVPVDTVAGPVVLAAPHPVPVATRPLAVAWLDPGRLVVLGADRSGYSLSQVDVDGSEAAPTQHIPGLPGAPSDLSTAPGAPVLIDAGTGLYFGSGHRVRTGTDAAYPG